MHAQPMSRPRVLLLFFVSSFGSVKGCLLGVVFSAACSFSLAFPLYASGRSLAACVVLALPLLIVLTIALSVIVRLSFKLDKCQELQNNHVRLFVFATVSFIAIWIVFGLLPLYPGCYSTDSVDILKMISGLPFESDHFRYDALNNHHPAAYVFFVSVIFKACSIFGLSKFACAAMISFAHLVILGLCCGFIVYKVSRLFNRPIITLFCFSFLLCDPLLVWYSVTVWKDVIFSGLFVCFALSGYQGELEAICQSFTEIDSCTSYCLKLLVASEQWVYCCRGGACSFYLLHV